ncbi:acyl-CoA dehydrogenase family protein [Pseudomonas nicosulfuronedens]
MAYARSRAQGTELGSAKRDKVAILRHTDIRRMLMSMKSRIEAMRALACSGALAMDQAEAHPDSQQRARQQAFVDLMTPVVKAWSTENAIDIASLGVQIHGGMGFIEQTGAAQHLREARITTSYEGTTGIQANDLVSRKVARDKGQAIGALLQPIRQAAHRLPRDNKVLEPIGSALVQGADALRGAAIGQKRTPSRFGSTLQF